MVIISHHRSFKYIFRDFSALTKSTEEEEDGINVYLCDVGVICAPLGCVFRSTAASFNRASRRRRATAGHELHAIHRVGGIYISAFFFLSFFFSSKDHLEKERNGYDNSVTDGWAQECFFSFSWQRGIN